MFHFLGLGFLFIPFIIRPTKAPLTALNNASEAYHLFPS
jgi:hypothetical protein